jgi:quercetin dioxygenase-like cupin family protein
VTVSPVDLDESVHRAGPQWGMQSADLNATLLAWPAGGSVAEHRNDEIDVLIVVLHGSATIRVDGVDNQLATHELLLVPRGSTRAVTAGADGVRYLSVHRRREPLLPVRRLAGP